MHRLWIAVAFLLLASPVQAGVYILDEHHPDLRLDQTRGYYLDIRSISVAPLANKPMRPDSPRANTLRKAEALQQLKAEGPFSALDRISLAGCYLRLGGERIPEAVRLLNAGDQRHFLIQSNLAAAYFLSGELAMAVRHQQRALDLWPEVFAPWPAQRLRGHRVYELFLLKLYRSREEESRRGPVRGPVDVDPLFPRVRFIGASGQYEAGGLSREMRDQLPSNAIDIVYALLISFPTDMRLYWLFGELLNTAGSVDQAHDIFVELVETGTAGSFKDLPKHRRVLVEAKPAFTQFRDGKARAMLLSEWMLIPRATFAAPGLGDAAYVASTGAALAWVSRGEQIDPNDFQQPPAVTGPPQQVFNFGHIAIGFGFGFVAASLLAMQWQEWRRRRSRADFAREEREPVPLRPPPGQSTSITPGG